MRQSFVNILTLAAAGIVSVLATPEAPVVYRHSGPEVLGVTLNLTSTTITWDPTCPPHVVPTGACSNPPWQIVWDSCLWPDLSFADPNTICCCPKNTSAHLGNEPWTGWLACTDMDEDQVREFNKCCGVMQTLPACPTDSL